MNGSINTRPMFFLGQIKVMANVFSAVQNEEILNALERHVRCDWGEVDIEARNKNTNALIEKGCLLSLYHTASNIKFWIITNQDESITTILLSDPRRLH